jgi:hypothetical protein
VPETEKQRVDRELIELLNELRVALPGVQVLFAFLLTLPFTRRFQDLGVADRALYFSAVILTTIATGFLIAPSAHHRLRFRARDKEALVIWGNRMAICGLVALALAIAASVSVIADFLYGERVRIPVTLALLLGLSFLWFVVPRLYSGAPEDDERRELRD